MPTFSRTSYQNMSGLHSHLILVLDRAIRITKQDFIVLPTSVRNQQQQDDMYEQGRSRPGKIITWTRNSRHIKKFSKNFPDEGRVSHAVDLCPYPVDWDDKKKFFEIGKAMLGSAIEYGTKLRWGYDWDGDGILMEKGESDGPHFELSIRHYPT